MTNILLSWPFLSKIFMVTKKMDKRESDFISSSRVARGYSDKGLNCVPVEWAEKFR